MLLTVRRQGKVAQGKNGVYQKGQETAAKILRAAEDILIEEGYRSLSFRKIASEAGITAGNLQYYFPSKDELIQALLNRIIDDYIADLQTLRVQAGDNPDEQFAAVISHIVADLNAKHTTHFFPELWALANHEEHIAELMEDMYRRYRAIIQEVVELMNPALTDTQAKKITLFITSSIEGHTMFVGYRKPWKKETKEIIALAVKSFTHIVHSPPF